MKKRLASQVWFRVCTVCLSLYIAYCTWLAQSPLFESAGATALSLGVFALLCIGLFCGLTWGCGRIEGLSVRTRRQLAKPVLRVFLAAFALALCVLGTAFAAAYPGGVNYDISNQWHQIHSGEYNNWHPVFHTLLVKLLLSVCGSYPAAVFFQVVLMSLALANLTATLHKHGVPAWLALAVQVFVAASRPVRNPAVYMGKDAAMAVGILLLTAQAIEMLYTRGAWLKKPLHALLLGLLLGYVTLLRINALFWTAPFWLCVFFAYKPVRKQAALSLLVMAGLMVIVQGPVYGSLDIVYPNNTVEESVGLPMTVLGDIKQCEGDKLDAETNAFLATLASGEAWQTTYRLHNYNSIKFSFDRERIKYTPLGDILRMTARSAAAAPRTAFAAFNGLTDLVWGVTGEDEGYTYVRNSGDIAELPMGKGRINQMGQKACNLIDWVMDLPPLRYIACNIGVQQLLLLLVTLWALRKHDSAVLLLALPSILYNMGTMLLLCGNDARFFQFFMAIALPSVLALVYLPRNERGTNPCK